jgi:RecB family endonuclease NucS
MQPWIDSEGRAATEFPADDHGRRIDIMAKDRQGSPVVIELKASRGHERVIGQALYYRASIKQRWGSPKVRIIIVAREISKELRLATKEIGDAELFEYHLSMTLNKV